ncbi:MAG: hypothetical protein PHW24_00015 [Candidatus Moranbacteria bacterium]|nr:hypothetical protein [Candidatus Moranbacteria bacterium]
MFDLTKQIRLSTELQKKYQLARAVLHVVFVVSALFIAYRILFPIIPMDFSIANPSSNKNTLVFPRLGQAGEFPKKGLLPKGSSLFFNANPTGQFSSAVVNLTFDKNGQNLEGTTVKINKSYQAFFFPTGEPVGFKDGTLLTTENGAYYIVSNGLLRKFANTDIILQLGFPKSAFMLVSQDDLKYNKPGNDVADTLSYPENSLFAIGDNYYELKNGKLLPFISTQAFLSQYPQTAAIAKNSDFFAQYPASETSLGFADGTLGSAADSVYILSEGKSYPVASANSFNVMGLNWNDIIPLDQNELSIYDKQKQFTVDDPHPNGIIFKDQKTNELFIIKDGKKLPVPNETILKTYSKQRPIIASLDDSKLEASCTLKKKLFSDNNYACQTSLENLMAAVGNDYQINVAFPNGATITNLNATFSTPFNWESMRNSLSKIKTAIAER